MVTVSDSPACNLSLCCCCWWILLLLLLLFCLFVCCMGLLLNPSPFFSPFFPSHSDSLLLLLLLSWLQLNLLSPLDESQPTKKEKRGFRILTAIVSSHPMILLQWKIFSKNLTDDQLISSITSERDDHSCSCCYCCCCWSISRNPTSKLQNCNRVPELGSFSFESVIVAAPFCNLFGWEERKKK